MIRRIESLKGHGIFRDFSGDAKSGIPEFDRFNIIYGWNYSGKTTLARVFRALERKSLDPSYRQAKFVVSLEDGTTVTSADLTRAPCVKVFNRDFVDTNFQAEHTAPAVFIIGEDNAALKGRLAQLKGRIDRVETLALEATSEKSKIESDLLDQGTNRAREIATLLGVRDFRRPNLQSRVEEVRGGPDRRLLTDEVVQGHHAMLRSGEDYSELGLADYTIPDLPAAAAEVSRLLAQTASRRAIDELAGDSNLEAWARQGLPLHKDRLDCGFCGAALRGERLNELQGHFSDAYESLLRELQEEVANLETTNLVVDLPDEMRLLPEARARFSRIKQELESWYQWAVQVRRLLIDALVEKQSNIESVSNWTGDLSRAAEISNILQGLNAVLERHNRIVAGVEKAKAEAREALELHYSAEFFKASGVEDNERQCAELQNFADRANRLKYSIKEQKASIEARISASSIGAEKLNELLGYLLAGCNIQVQKVGESEFRFLRDGEPAVNLSDGEKTAVTFSYFLTSLEAEGSSPEDTIVFVDDPISSLDSNHVYAVFSLICERIGRCKQLFVSTHNSEFFNLLKGEWLGPNGGNKPDSSAYRIFRKERADGPSQACISDLPQLLRRYKSEYEFVFSHLYRFAKNPAPSEHEAYAAPALLRRFLEAYLGFRKPGIRKWHEKLDLLFDAAEMRHEIHRFADDAAHLQSLDRSLQHPDIVSSSRRCVRSVLDALQVKDHDHYDSLVRIIECESDV